MKKLYGFCGKSCGNCIEIPTTVFYQKIRQRAHSSPCQLGKETRPWTCGLGPATPGIGPRPQVRSRIPQIWGKYTQAVLGQEEAEVPIARFPFAKSIAPITLTRLGIGLAGRGRRLAGLEFSSARHGTKDLPRQYLFCPSPPALLPYEFHDIMAKKGGVLL